MHGCCRSAPTGDIALACRQYARKTPTSSPLRSGACWTINPLGWGTPVPHRRTRGESQEGWPKVADCHGCGTKKTKPARPTSLRGGLEGANRPGRPSLPYGRTSERRLEAVVHVCAEFPPRAKPDRVGKTRG